MKSTIEQIRQRFDHDVERFSNLETGQTATIDAPLVLELITQAAAAVNPQATRILDIGCGAGNYTLKLLQLLPQVEVTLVDLSQPMLERAVERIGQVTSAEITSIQGDIREIAFAESQFDVILAAAVLHHLRQDTEWEAVFAKLYSILKPGGSVWISDLIEHSTPLVQTLMRSRYGDYLAAFKDETYRDHVFDYVAQEDSPRPLLYQLDLLRQVGFAQVELLHKNSCFAAFGAIKQHA
jgi:tRNA (cmo5U34)-methyltransferase